MSSGGVPDLRVVEDRSTDAEAELQLELPSDVRLIERAVTLLTERCRAFDIGGSRLNLNFRVGVTEAIANAVLYGNRQDASRHVHVRLHIDPHRVCVRVADGGTGFEPEGLPDPTRGENIYRSRGRGIFLLRELMDEVRFNARGNEVFLVLQRTS